MLGFRFTVLGLRQMLVRRLVPAPAGQLDTGM